MSAGTKYGLEGAQPAMAGAADLINLLMEEINRTSEEDAGRCKSSWALSLHFISQSLFQASDEAYQWLKHDERPNAPNNPA